MRAEFYDFVELARDGLDVRKEKKVYKPLLPASMAFPSGAEISQKANPAANFQLGRPHSAERVNRAKEKRKPRSQSPPRPQLHVNKQTPSQQPLVNMNVSNWTRDAENPDMAQGLYKIDNTAPNDPAHQAYMQQQNLSNGSGELKTTTIEIFGQQGTFLEN